ncbi:Methyltransferase-like protein 24 [Durusdinium trenchii]|uniref:Methyltransferase-like protein 24 n=1 Tax=Durusdinium trenchii TaxID=1381693 RepID=A0ABP0N8S2_9DINO
MPELGLMGCARAAIPTVGAFCAVSLFVFSRVLCKSSSSPQFLAADLERDQASLKQVELLRAEVYRGQTDVLQALENLRLQVAESKRALPVPVPAHLSNNATLAANATAPPTPTPTVPPVRLPPLPVAAPVTAGPTAAVTMAPLATNLRQGDGPIWDSKVIMIERKAEKQYWYQRQEKNAPIHPAFIKYNSNWPCLWGEEYTGQGSGDGNKWTCGARLIQAPCVVYSFGSNNDMKFELGIHELGLHCEIHIYDPTSPEPRDARRIGARFHKVGLGARDGFQGRFPVKTLKSLMKENGHSHIDILKVDIEDAEHEAIPQIAHEGWPSVGQFLVEVHIRNFANDMSLDKLITLIEKGNLRLFHQEVNWQYGASCCTEYAFIHKDWRPERKKYDMMMAATFVDVPLRDPRQPLPSHLRPPQVRYPAQMPQAVLPRAHGPR